MFDLQKSVATDKINLYVDRLRGHENQVFPMWISDDSSDVTGDPKENGWKYVGVYASGGGRRGFATSLEFGEELKGCYLMFQTDGVWHGNRLPEPGRQLYKIWIRVFLV